MHPYIDFRDECRRQSCPETRTTKHRVKDNWEVRIIWCCPVQVSVVSDLLKSQNPQGIWACRSTLYSTHLLCICCGKCVTPSSCCYLDSDQQCCGLQGFVPCFLKSVGTGRFQKLNEGNKSNFANRWCDISKRTLILLIISCSKQGKLSHQKQLAEASKLQTKFLYPESSHLSQGDNLKEPAQEISIPLVSYDKYLELITSMEQFGTQNKWFLQ